MIYAHYKIKMYYNSNIFNNCWIERLFPVMLIFAYDSFVVVSYLTMKTVLRKLHSIFRKFLITVMLPQQTCISEEHKEKKTMPS